MENLHYDDEALARFLEENTNQKPFKSNALKTQVGGNHYKDMKIQPVEFITANNIPFLEGNIIKYICRWRKKNGVQDLHKIRHYIDLLIQLEEAQNDKG